ncbi:MAG: STAS domain-containing protein [Desulfobacterales bacterium]|nr:STAS domain-containing protein [Desulfobacterales bacterium]
MGFRIDSTKDKGIVQIRVEGEIDMFTSPDLRDTLLPCFSSVTKAIVVDLSGVSFMDSSGIATLVEGLQWSQNEDREFVLAGLGKTVFNALSLTKLDNVFSIEKDMDTALTGLGYKG